MMGLYECTEVLQSEYQIRQVNLGGFSIPHEMHLDKDLVLGQSRPSDLRRSSTEHSVEKV